VDFVRESKDEIPSMIISKIIHYCWFGNNAMTALNRDCLKSWRDVCPDFHIKLWNEANSPMDIPYLKKAYGSKKWANLSNFMRLYAVYQEGGIYLDCDMKLIKPLDSFLHDECFMGWQGYDPFKEGINNAILGAFPKHPFIGELLKEYPEKFSGDESAAESSPIFMSQKLVELGLTQYNDESMNFKGIRLYPVRYFYPFPHTAEFDKNYIFPDTHGIHFWEGTWFKKQVSKLTQLQRMRRSLSKIKAKVVDKVRSRKKEKNIRVLKGMSFFIHKNHQVVVSAIIKNASALIPTFLKHYEDMGVDRIVILDNGSSDDTLQRIPSKKNITVLQADLSLKEYKNEIWLKNYLANRFAKGSWCLWVDDDELFDFPFSEQISLPTFIRYLNLNKFTTVVTQMLDMFSKNPINSQVISTEEENLKAAYRFYDLTDLMKLDYGSCYFTGVNNRENIISNRQIPFYFGGIRKKIFGMSNCISKHSLLYINGKTQIIHSHCVKNARCADVSAVVYHYKFFGDWLKRTRDYFVQEYARNPEYAEMLKVVDGKEDFSLWCPKANEINETQSLVGEGFSHVSEAYKEFVSIHKESNR
jgi:hypothetical protein